MRTPAAQPSDESTTRQRALVASGRPWRADPPGHADRGYLDFLELFEQERSSGGKRTLAAYQTLFPGLDREIAKAYHRAELLDGLPAEPMWRSRWRLWALLLGVVLAFALTLFAGVRWLEARGRGQKAFANALYRLLDGEQTKPGDERLVLGRLHPSLRPAVDLDPLDLALWDQMLDQASEMRPVPPWQFDLLGPRNAVVGRPVFRFTSPDPRLPHRITVTGGPDGATRQYDVPQVSQARFLVCMPPLDEPLEPGDYVWEVSIDRTRVEPLDPPVVAIPPPAQREFRLASQKELEDILRRGGVAQDPALDAYLRCWSLVQAGLADRAIDELEAIAAARNPMLGGVDRWRYLRARLHLLQEEPEPVAQLFLALHSPEKFPAEPAKVGAGLEGAQQQQGARRKGRAGAARGKARGRGGARRGRRR